MSDDFQAERRKLAIVMSGGGMRCAYGAGVMAALAEQRGIVEPDFLIAASGSAGTSAYYLSRQYQEGVAIWLSDLASRRFISYERRTFIDIDYLIDSVFRTQHPLNLAALQAAHTTWLLSATRVRDGSAVYLEPRRDERVYEYLRAAKAIPFLYGKAVTIDGNEFFDGEFGMCISDSVHKALSLGARDIIIIDSNPGSAAEIEHRALLRFCLAEAQRKGHSGIVAATMRMLQSQRPNEEFKGASLIRLAPRDVSHISAATTSPVLLRELFNAGYEDALADRRIAQLIKPSISPSMV